MSEHADPYAGYNFVVELDGSARAGFRECAGLENSQNAAEYREGTDRNLAPQKIPGLHSHSGVTLSRGVSTDADLWEWRAKTMKGMVERRAITITLRDDTGSPRIAWNLLECWPTSWTGPDFVASGDERAIDQLVLACERIEVTTWE